MTNKLIDRMVWNDGYCDYQDMWVEEAMYGNGHIALMLVNAEEGPITTITVNLLEPYGIEPQPHCFFIKNYSENKGLGQALVTAGVVERTERPTASFGPYDATADEYRFTPEFLKGE